MFAPLNHQWLSCYSFALPLHEQCSELQFFRAENTDGIGHFGDEFLQVGLIDCSGTDHSSATVVRPNGTCEIITGSENIAI